MLKNILNTLSVKAASAVISLLLVIINSNVLGAKGLGEISLILLAITIFNLISGVVSGALVYFVPRENNFKLLLISYLWVPVTAVFFGFLILTVEIAPRRYYLHIMVLAVVQSIAVIHEKILLGRERISAVNFIFLTKTLLLLISVSLLYFIYFQKQSVTAYITALYVSFGFSALANIILSLKYLRIENLRGLLPIFKKMLRLSGSNALANIVSKMNHRLGFYFIEYFYGTHTLGIFALAVQIIESTFIISRSAAFVQYSKIANITDKLKNVRITLLFVKFVFLISLITATILCILPGSFYQWVFGNDFAGVNWVIMAMGVGIIALSCADVITPYFSGTGKHYYNMYSSLAGFAITVTVGFLFIKFWGLLGGGIAVSVSYAVSLITDIYFFKRDSGIKLNRFFIKYKDITQASRMVLNTLREKRIQS